MSKLLMTWVLLVALSLTELKIVKPPTLHCQDELSLCKEIISDQDKEIALFKEEVRPAPPRVPWFVWILTGAAAATLVIRK